MTIIEMLQQSSILTILGVATVFGFIALMVFCIGLVGKIINRTGKKQPLEKGVVLPETVAAITAAVSEYRKSKE